MKSYSISDIKVKCTNNNVIDGFVMRRNLTAKEAFFVVSAILGITLNNAEDFKTMQQYELYKNDITDKCNCFLNGSCTQDRLISNDIIDSKS